MSIALNIIVAGGESEELVTCLNTFDAHKTFDEIVIGNTSQDDGIESAVVNYASKHSTDKIRCIRVPWRDEEYPYGNFARARNAVLDATKSEYVMWLDADDQCIEKHREKLEKLRTTVNDPKNKSIELYIMPYATLCDENGTPVALTQRERVIKNLPQYRWKFAVHESVSVNYRDIRHGVLNNMYVTHRPLKPNYQSALRNVQILKHEIEKGKKGGFVHPHDMYYYCRDMIVCGKIKDAIDQINDFIENYDAPPMNKYELCLQVAFYLTYGNMQFAPMLNEMKTLDNKMNGINAESWLRLALSFSHDYAEVHVLLGDVYTMMGEYDSAIRMYRIAYQKEMRVGMPQIVTYYKYLPYQRLSFIFARHKKDYEKALWYNKFALQNAPEEHVKKLLTHRKMLVSKLNQEIVEEINAVGKN